MSSDVESKTEKSHGIKNCNTLFAVTVPWLFEGFLDTTDLGLDRGLVWVSGVLLEYNSNTIRVLVACYCVIRVEVLIFSAF